ncbi:EGF-like domain protein, partial [Trichuris suis]
LTITDANECEGRKPFTIDVINTVGVTDSYEKLPALKIYSALTPDESNNCTNNSTCFNTHHSYICICEEGWHGQFCQLDIDECENKLSRCDQHGRCINTPGSYYCNCSAGYTGKYCERGPPKKAAPASLGTVAIAAPGTIILTFYLVLEITYW